MATGGLSSLKVVSFEYIYIVSYFSSFKPAALDPALMDAQFPAICCIKGVYVAQLNLEINWRRLAWSSQDTTRNGPVHMLIFCASMLQCNTGQCLCCFVKSLKFASAVSRSCEKTAHKTGDDFVLFEQVISVEVCFYSLRPWLYLPLMHP